MALLVGACGEEAVDAPMPISLTAEAAGYYCQMTVLEHEGPKGQIFLAELEAPFWFPSVRDAIAFTMLPEESKRIVAIYVNDMAGATDWSSPGDWIDARAAWYVLDGARAGGMGAPETVPFSDRAAAERYAAEQGGRVVAFEDIPTDYVLEYVAPDQVDS